MFLNFLWLQQDSHEKKRRWKIGWDDQKFVVLDGKDFIYRIHWSSIQAIYMYKEEPLTSPEEMGLGFAFADKTPDCRLDKKTPGFRGLARQIRKRFGIKTPLNQLRYAQYENYNRYQKTLWQKNII